MTSEGKPMVHVRKRQATNVPAYDYEQHGHADRGGSQPPKIILPEFADQISIEGPRGWDKMTVPFTVRIFPAINPDDTGKFLQCRRPDSPTKFTDWFRAIPIVRYVGVGKAKQVTFFPYDPRLKDTEGYDVNTNPYMILFEEFHRACKAAAAYIGKRNVLTVSWHNMKSNSDVREQRSFSKQQVAYFFQGAVYSNNTRALVKTGNLPQGLGPKDKTQIIMMTDAAGRELIRQLRIPASNSRVEDPANIAKQFLHGDVTRLKAGKFVSLYHPGLTETMATKYPDAFKVMAATQLPKDADERGGGGFDSYELLIHDTCKLIPDKQRIPVTIPADISAHVDSVRQHYMWWDDIFYFPNHEEVCEILAQAFRDAPDVIWYGWRDNPEFLTTAVRGILNSRTTGPGADVPGEEDDLPAEDLDEPAVSRGMLRRGEKLRGASVPDVDDVGEFMDDVDDPEEAVPPPRSRKASSKKVVEPEYSDEDDAELEAEPDAAESVADFEEDVEDFVDEEAAPPPPPPKRTVAKAPPPPQRATKPAATVAPPAKRKPPVLPAEDEEAQEDVLNALNLAKHRAKKRG